MTDLITAQRSTVLKRRNAPSDTLPDEQKRSVVIGETFQVDDYEQASGLHWRVLLEDGWWYAFDNGSDGKFDHWRCSWEDDQTEAEVAQALNIVSQVPTDNALGNQLKVGSPFSARITPHITYGEFALYQEERRFDYQHQIETAVLLAQFLEQCRAHFDGNPLRISSGYRPPKVNSRVGGARFSEHLYRAPMTGAVDFFVVGVPLGRVLQYSLENWPYSVGKGERRGFVHLGIRGVQKNIVWDY